MTMRFAAIGAAAILALVAAGPAAAAPARPGLISGSNTFTVDGRHRHHHPRWGYRPHPGYYAPRPYYHPYYSPPRYYAPPPYFAPPPYYGPPRYYSPPPGPGFYFQFRN